MLRRRRVRGHERLGRQRDLPTASHLPQLVPDPVLDGAAQVDAQRPGLFRLEAAEPRERVMQRVLDQVAGVDRPARPRRQAAPRPAPQPRPIPSEQRVHGRAAAPSRPRQQTPLGAGTTGTAVGGGWLRGHGDTDSSSANTDRALRRRCQARTALGRVRREEPRIGGANAPARLTVRQRHRCSPPARRMRVASGNAPGSVAHGSVARLRSHVSAPSM